MYKFLQKGAFTASCLCSIIFVVSPSHAEYEENTWLAGAGSAFYRSAVRADEPALEARRGTDSRLARDGRSYRTNMLDPVSTGSLTSRRSNYVVDYPADEIAHVTSQ